MHRPTALLAAACAVFLTLPGAALAQELFPWSSEQLIPQSTLADLTCDDLWWARNEIYARNGYIFQTARGRRAFGDQGWTRNPDLNRTEQQNVANIQRYERRYGCN